MFVNVVYLTGSKHVTGGSSTVLADQRQPVANISEDRNRARRERDRAQRNSLTTEQKKEINARRRAARQSKALTDKQKEKINARRRAARQSNALTAEKKKEINARRRTTRQNKTVDERNTIQRASRQNIAPQKRQALLAKRKANAAARQNIPCADSIALPCPIVASLAALRQAKEGATSPPVSPSRSTQDYIIGTEGDYSIFILLLMLRLIKPLLTGYWTLQMTWRAYFGGSWTRMHSATTSWMRRTTYMMMKKVCSPTFPLALFVMS
jgi:hypothetical protein